MVAGVGSPGCFGETARTSRLVWASPQNSTQYSLNSICTIFRPFLCLFLLFYYLFLNFPTFPVFFLPFSNFLRLSQTFSNSLQLTFTRKNTLNTQNNSLNLLRTDPRGPRELREGPQGTPGTSTKQYVLVNFLNWSGTSSCDGST